MLLKLLNYKTYFFALSIILIQGCSFHDSQRLVPEDIIEQVAKLRKDTSINFDDESTFTLKDAALLMSEKNPELLKLKENYKGASKIADTWAPLPNPKVESGVAVGFDLDEDGDERNVQPYVSLGFAIPLGPRLSRQNHLNDVLKDQAYNDLISTHRDLYIQLRRNYIQFSVARERLEEQAIIVSTVKDTQTTGEKLLKLGTINSLGLNSINIELNKVYLDKIDFEILFVENSSLLADLIGTSITVFEDKPCMKLPVLPETLPELETLKQLMLKNNTSLSRLEMKYKVDDAALKVELAKQVPDLELGSSYDQEVGEDKKVLASGAGIEIPIFDRNQQGILEEENRRNLTALEYHKEMNKALSHLESGIKLYNLYLKQYNKLENEMLPLSLKNIKSAERALRIGHLDVLLFLELQKEHRNLLIKQIDLKADLWKALLDLEDITGYPLLMFPDEVSYLSPNIEKDSEPVTEHKNEMDTKPEPEIIK